MFEVGDRRTPSTPGWAGKRKRRSAVLVMANGNPVPRVRRGKEAAVGEGFLAPPALTAKGDGASDPRLAVAVLQASDAAWLSF
jgi:hypothetical protein